MVWQIKREGANLYIYLTEMQIILVDTDDLGKGHPKDPVPKQ